LNRYENKFCPLLIFPILVFNFFLSNKLIIEPMKNTINTAKKLNHKYDKLYIDIVCGIDDDGNDDDDDNVDIIDVSSKLILFAVVNVVVVTFNSSFII
jgi:hypothetical protein